MILPGKPHYGDLPRVWLEIYGERIRGNLETIAKYVSPLRVMAVLKANAYGLGAIPITDILSTSSVYCFGVAEVAVASAVRHAGKPVHIIGALVDEDIPAVVREGHVAPITDARIAKLLSREAVARNTKVKCQYKIDTGMGRLGIIYDEAYETILETHDLPGLDIVGIYSHFPVAYEDLEFSRHQVTQLVALIDKLSAKGIRFELIHVANSDGIHNIPEAIKPPFNMVRTGINLYGAYDPEGNKAFDLEPAFEFKTRLVAIRDLPVGTTIGYGRKFKLEKGTRVGTIAIGYADGIPFDISGRGAVSIRGKRCPVIGRISMDFTTIDMDSVPDAAVGDEVICIGNGVWVDEWAEYKGTSAYDIICSVGSRVERRYV